MTRKQLERERDKLAEQLKKNFLAQRRKIDLLDRGGFNQLSIKHWYVRGFNDCIELLAKAKRPTKEAADE